MLLGDAVHEALARLDVTPQKIEEWLGKPCHCKERQERLNALHRWARTSMKSSTGTAYRWLLELVGFE